MCIQHVATFGRCGHTAEYVETERCQTKDCVNPPKQRAIYESQTCLNCTGEARRRRDSLTLYYKHCYLSRICGHEYNHALTDAKRDHSAEDIILVTPVLYPLCPACDDKGYDRRPGGSNPPPKTASIVPRDFQDIERVEVEAITLLDTDGIAIDGAKVAPSNSFATKNTPLKSSEYITKAPSFLRYQTHLPNSTKPTSSTLRKTFGPSAAELARIAKLLPIATDSILKSLRNNSPSSSNIPESSKTHTDLQPSLTTMKPLPSQAQHKRVRFILPPTADWDSDLEERAHGVTSRPSLDRGAPYSATPRVRPDGTIIPPPRSPGGNSVYPRMDASTSRTPTRRRGELPPSKKTEGR